MGAMSIASIKIENLDEYIQLLNQLKDIIEKLNDFELVFEIKKS